MISVSTTRVEFRQICYYRTRYFNPKDTRTIDNRALNRLCTLGDYLRSMFKYDRCEDFGAAIKYRFGGMVGQILFANEPYCHAEIRDNNGSSLVGIGNDGFWERLTFRDIEKLIRSHYGSDGE